MSIYEIIILALALALDAMIVSFSYGLIITSKRFENVLKLALSFGFFQFLMPIIGWYIADYIYIYIKNFSKWIVFSVFILLAIKLLKEVISAEEDVKNNCISLWCLFCLAVATSIDALGAGISIRFLETKVIFPAVLIGIITFMLSILGFNLSTLLKKINSKILKSLAVIMFVYLAVKSLYI